MKKLSGILVYVCVQKPVKSYQEPGTPAKPDEWKASVVLTDESEVDAFEEYIKELGAKVSITKVKAADFETIYKTSLPDGAGNKVWVVTLRKSTQLGKTGKEVPEMFRPKVFEKVGNKIIDITNQKLVGNGSKGQISIEQFDGSNGKTRLYLKNVLVTDLVEYIQKEYDAPGSEFDEDENSSEQPASTNVEKSKKNKKDKSLVDDDDDVPF